MKKLIVGLFFCATLPVFGAQTKTPIQVRVDLIEALSPTDTTSSLRFQNEFELSINTAKANLKAKLDKCGYALETSTAFFDATDPLQAKEKAEKATTDGSWLIVGPRRSNHYLLLAKGSGKTPTVSLMASASEIGDLGPSHVSLSPSNAQMARAAAIESKSRVRSATNYVSITSEDCVSCVDFAQIFEKEAGKIGLKNSGNFSVKGESPQLGGVVEKVVALNPKIILIPNYSKVAAQIISVLAPKLKSALFVGSDGWGDSNFGFLQNDVGVASAKGITVRGFPPVSKGLQLFPLGKAVTRTGKDVPTSGPGMAILKSLDGVAEILCESRPASKEAFSVAFEKTAKRKLSAPFGVSVYDLVSSNIVYEKKVSVKP
ncbi:MAG: hypothetical protein JST04_12815 [Bdellovibrionales bacterium]|nr:hypothetical protein [Bdellovibrionales bacterium]